MVKQNRVYMEYLVHFSNIIIPVSMVVSYQVIQIPEGVMGVFPSHYI